MLANSHLLQLRLFEVGCNPLLLRLHNHHDLLRRVHPARKLRVTLARDTVELQRKLDDCEKIGVVDLLGYEAMEHEVAGIPCAVRVDPQRLSEGQRVAVPQGVSIVPYSSSKNDFASARVTQALSRIGITDVWILGGGLDAWVGEGRPTTVTLSTREELAMRLGIVLPSAGLKRHIEGLA